MNPDATEETLDECYDALHRLIELAEELGLVLDVEAPLAEVTAEIERRARKQIL